MTKTRRIVGAIKAFFSGKKGLLRALTLVVVPSVFALVPNMAAATGCDWTNIPCHAAHFLTWFFEILTALMGYIIVLLVDGLIRVASYDNFVAPGPSAVSFGWVVTRDLANMFFIVFLLIIAFATVIGYEKYAYRSNLRRLLIMAVVINFSKTICGLFIDLSQVLMLSFVNGFKAAAAGNFLRAFQIEKLLKLADGESSYTFGLVLAMMFAFILAAITACVMLVLVVIMIFRIVTLWVLIILSPIAFLSSSFTGLGHSYYGEWWGMFKANLISGPVIAFFLWLALATAQQTGGNIATEQGWGKSSDIAKQETTSAGAARIGGETAKIPTEAATTDTILSTIIMISILFAGLKFASEAKVAGAGFAKTVRGQAEGALKRAAMAPVGQVGGAFQSVGGRAMSRVGAGLARVPIVGGLGRRMALTGEKLEEGRRKEREAKWGGAKELAKYSPGQFGSTHRLRGATDAQISETAAIAASDPKAMANLQKYGGSGMVRDRLKKMADKDPAANKAAYDSFMKANWQGAVDDKGEMTKDARAAVLGRHSGEDAKKFIAAEDFNEEVARGLEGPALSDYLNNGKDAQKKKAVEVLNGMAPAEREKLMKEKRMSYSNISAETLELAMDPATGIDKAANLRAGALAAADKDSSLMKKFADDPKMRDQLEPLARANLAAAIASGDADDMTNRQKTLNKLGAAKSSDYDAPGMEEAVGSTVTVKDFNEMERNAPTDNPEAMASLERAITAALKHGSTETVQAIMRSPTLSQHADFSASEKALKSTSSHTSSVNSEANTKLAELDRRRKDAASSDDPAVKSAALGISDDIKEIRDAMDVAKAAAKELAEVEGKIVASRAKFADAKKGGRTADMSRFAAEIKAALVDALDRKDKLAKANDRLSEAT